MIIILHASPQLLPPHITHIITPSPQNKKMPVPTEEEYVKDVYNHIATQFDNTRHALWPCVTLFLDRLAPRSVVLDVGCGNGKYLSYRDDLVMHACDNCDKLIDIARLKSPNTIFTNADCIDLPYPDNTFDAVISVAVMHHLSTPERRSQFMSEIHRVAKHGAPVLVTVWASTLNDPRSVKYKDQEGDVLILWRNEHMRYYHLFDQHELIYYAQAEFPHVTSDDIYFEKDNWVLQTRKQ